MKRARDRLPVWSKDPVAFADEALWVLVWARQEEILRAVAEHDRVAVRSGHKIGKSTSAVIIALWWFCTRKRARVIMTSATYRQVKAILWKELKRVLGERPGVAPRPAEDPETGLVLIDGREIVGLSTKDPEKIAGYSGPSLLFILDEASGIPEAIFEAIEGNRAGGAKLVMFSNPTRTSGTFFDAFHTKREFWRTIHVSSEETPNVTGEGKPIPGLATRAWVDEKRKEWGEDSSIYQVRVRGNFPMQGDNAIVALHLVEEATQRWHDDDPKAEGVLHIGVDVARFGDDNSVIRARRGLRALEQRIKHGLDGEEVAGEVLAMVRELRMGDEKPIVNVDVIGVGASVVDHLKHSTEIELHAVNVSEAATAEGFGNLRAQLWFGMADWLKEGGTYESDSELDAELVAPTYRFDSQGRRVVVAKEEIKKILGRSPDKAEALMLSIYTPPKKKRGGVVFT